MRDPGLVRLAQCIGDVHQACVAGKRSSIFERVDDTAGKAQKQETVHRHGPADIGDQDQSRLAFVVIAITGLWVLYRIIKGLLTLLDEQPMPFQQG